MEARHARHARHARPRSVWAVLALCLTVLTVRLTLHSLSGASQFTEEFGFDSLRVLNRKFSLPTVGTTALALSSGVGTAATVALACLEAAYVAFVFSDQGAQTAAEAAAAAAAAIAAVSAAAASNKSQSCVVVRGSELSVGSCGPVLGLTGEDALFVRAAASLGGNISSNTIALSLTPTAQTALQSMFDVMRDSGLEGEVSRCSAAFETLTCGLAVAPECAADCSAREPCASSLCAWMWQQCPISLVLEVLLTLSASEYRKVLSGETVTVFMYWIERLKDLCSAELADPDAVPPERCDDFFQPGSWAERRTGSAGECTQASLAADERARGEAARAARAAVDRRRLIEEALASAVVAVVVAWLCLRAPRQLHRPDGVGVLLLAAPLLCSLGAAILSLCAMGSDWVSSAFGVGISVLQSQVLLFAVVSRLSGQEHKMFAPTAESSLLAHLLFQISSGGALYLLFKASVASVGLGSQARDMISFVPHFADVLFVDLLACLLSVNLMVYPQLLRIARHDLLLVWDITSSTVYLVIYIIVVYSRKSDSSAIGLSGVIALNVSIASLGFSSLVLFDRHQALQRPSRGSHVRNRHISIWASIRSRGLRSVIVRPEGRDSWEQQVAEPAVPADGGVVKYKYAAAHAHGHGLWPLTWVMISHVLCYTISILGVVTGVAYLHKSLAGRAACADALGPCLWANVAPRVLFPDGVLGPVACDLSLVQRADARGCGLRELGAAAQALANAAVFDLRGNPLRDIPAWLARRASEQGVAVLVDDLGSVERLDWSGAALSRLPDALLALAPQLAALNLSGNLLTELPSGLLGKLPKLRQLDLSHNALVALQDDVLALLLAPGREVRVAGNPVRKMVISASHVGREGRAELPQELSQLAQLEELSIVDTGCGGEVPSWIGQLTQLRWLNIQANNMSGTLALSSLQQLTKLQFLTLSDEPLLEVDFGDAPVSLPSLHTLQIGPVRGVRGARRTGANGSRIAVPSLRGMPELTALGMRSCNLSGAVDWDALQQDVPTLSTLDLSHNVISSTLPASLLQWRSLWRIDITDNQFYGPLPPAPAQPGLRLAGFAQNRFSGPLPPSWSSLRDVILIGLNNNELDGPIPPSWDDITWAGGHDMKNFTVDESVRLGLTRPPTTPP
jgi:Leucine-rich repeat (LRR) protein